MYNSNHPAYSLLAKDTQDELDASSLIYQSSLKNQGLSLVVRDYYCISSRQKRCLFARSSMCAILVHRLFCKKIPFSHNPKCTKKIQGYNFCSP
jgi:hypothetical protein